MHFLCKLTDTGLPARSAMKRPDDRSTLNTRRLHNPFSPTNEPDWVIVPKAPRRLPLPDPASSNADPRSAVVGSNGREQAFILPSPASSMSRQSSQGSIKSAASAVSRKPPPPIPRKPTILSRPVEQSFDNAAQASGDRSPHATRLKDPMNTRSSADRVASPTMPQRSQGTDGPPLPPRKMAGRPAPIELMDDDIESASNIPSLQPQRMG